MILVRKLKGEEMWVNPELLAFVEGGHESRLIFVDGRTVVIGDSPEDVADAIVRHRAKILALAFRMDSLGEAAALDTTLDPEARRHLQPVPSSEH